MKLATALKLGRVSNLPTVWSNVLAGMVLAGGPDAVTAGSGVTLALVLVAVTSLYVAGMFLNDAFDAGWDRENRPERPIPSGAATLREVFLWGGALLAVGPPLLLSAGVPAAAGGLALAAAIVAYDAVHKRFAHGSWIMGLCRALVYVIAGLALGGVTWDLLAGAAALMVYVAGLTYVARTEHLTTPAGSGALALLTAPLAFALTRAAEAPVSLAFLGVAVAWGVVCLRQLKPGPTRNAPAAVGGLIAGISLIDAVFLAAWGAPVLALAALAAFAATRWLHRLVAGT